MMAASSTASFKEALVQLKHASVDAADVDTTSHKALHVCNHCRKQQGGILSLCKDDAKVRVPCVTILAAVMIHCLCRTDTSAMLC